MTDLVDTTEMYLRTILDLEEEDIVPLRARISERLGHSGPTVSQTVARMERDGLVVVSGDRHLELTAGGRLKAMHVMRKHRLAERLLSDVIGLEWEFVHEEACRWEHVMSEQVEQKLIQMLGNPTESPYGNPIPSLDDVDKSPSVAFLAGVRSTVDFARAGGGTATVRRLGEPVQFDPELLLQLKQAGVVPGATASVTLAGNYVAIAVAGAGPGLELPIEVAVHIFVGDNGVPDSVPRSSGELA